MERSTVPEEENHAPWSSGSVIPIRAITIELKFPMEMQQTSENCQHSNFSIRGYAAEMRRRNPKASDPFQFDDVPSETTEGPTPLSKAQEKVPDAYINPDAADAEIETIEPSANTESGVGDEQANATDTDTDKAIDISSEMHVNDNYKVTQEETDDEFDDLLPLSELRKAVTRNLPKLLNSADDGQRVVETPLISGDPSQNIVVAETVDSVASHEVEDVSNAISDCDQSQQHGFVEKVNNAMSDSDRSQQHDPVEKVNNAMSNSDRSRQHDPVEKVNNAMSDSDQSQQHVPVEKVNNPMSDSDRSQQHDPVEKVNSEMSDRDRNQQHFPVEKVNSEMSDSDRNKQHFPVEKVNNPISIYDRSQQHVPSITVSRRKARKVRLLADLLCDEATRNNDHVREGGTSTSSRIIGSTGAPTSLTHGQILCDDVVRGANSPRTKGKMHQEGDGSLGQGTVAEKPNDLVSNGDAEPTAERRQISSSGSQANAPSAAGLQLGNKRGAEINYSFDKKKSKSAQIRESFPPIKISEPKSANVRSGDFKRCMSSNMSLSNSFGSPSAAAEPNNNSIDNQSPSETGRTSSDVTQTDLQIPNSTTVKGRSSRTGLHTLDGHHARTGSTRNQDGGETSSVQKKTDFRLAESIIPTVSAQDLLKRRQVLDLNERATHNSSYALAKGNFHEPKERDYCQEKIPENQGPWKSIIEQCERRHGKAVVQGSSDDIPMDIVELMAKNQYERTLGINAGSHLVPPRPINTMGSFLEVQNIRNTERPAVGYSASNSFSFPNARSGMSTPNTNMGTEKGNSIDYYQIGRNHFNMGRFDERQRSIFNAFQQNQQTISSRGQFSAAAAYVRPVPQRSVVLEPSSLSRSTVFPFGPDSQQKFSAQTPESSCDKGKTISDIKADELKKTKEARSVLPRSGAFDLNHKLKGPYSNDNIPAMQLHSLMDERSTGSTFNVGTSRFFDKPLTPPGYQVKSNAEGMRGFLNGSMSLQHNQANGVHNNTKRPFAFSGALSLDSQGQDILRERSQISGYVADVSDEGQTSAKGKDYRQKTGVVYSDIAEDPIQHSTSNNTQRSETESRQENTMPLRILPPNEFCSFNRNPADFSIPEAGNEFTIHGRDIKFRKRKYSRSTSSSVRIDEPKQQRNAKGKGKEK